MESLVALLKEMVQIDSTQYREAALGTYLAHLLEEEGYTVVRQEVPVSKEMTTIRADLPERFNIVATKKDPTLLFMGHLDTVQYTNKEMLNLTEKEGALWGRGAVDMKGGIAAFMQAVLNEENAHVGIIFTVDEEYGLEGVNTLAASPQFRSLHPHLLVIAEPTDLKIVNKHRGCYEIHASIEGKPAHASVPYEGVSALRVIHACERLETLLQCDHFKDVPSLFDTPSMNVGYLQAGTRNPSKNELPVFHAPVDENSVNSVPDFAIVKIDIRPTPQLHQKGLDYLIEKFKQETAKEQLRVLNVEKYLDFAPVTIERDKYGKVESVLESRGIPCEYSELSGFSEMGVVYNVLGCPCMNFGPGPETLSHTDNEHVDKMSLEKTYDVFSHLIRAYR